MSKALGRPIRASISLDNLQMAPRLRLRIMEGWSAPWSEVEELYVREQGVKFEKFEHVS